MKNIIAILAVLVLCDTAPAQGHPVQPAPAGDWVSLLTALIVTLPAIILAWRSITGKIDENTKITKQVGAAAASAATAATRSADQAAQQVETSTNSVVERIDQFSKEFNSQVSSLQKQFDDHTKKDETAFAEVKSQLGAMAVIADIKKELAAIADLPAKVEALDRHTKNNAEHVVKLREMVEQLGLKPPPGGFPGSLRTTGET